TPVILKMWLVTGLTVVFAVLPLRKRASQPALASREVQPGPAFRSWPLASPPSSVYWGGGRTARRLRTGGWARGRRASDSCCERAPRVEPSRDPALPGRRALHRHARAEPAA